VTSLTLSTFSVGAFNAHIQHTLLLCFSPRDSSAIINKTNPLLKPLIQPSNGTFRFSAPSSLSLTSFRRRSRLPGRIVQGDPLLRGAALRVLAAGPENEVARQFRSRRRLDLQRRPHRRLLRRRRQHQVRVSDGLHHHNALLECDRIRQHDASGRAQKRAGGNPLGHRLLAQNGFSAQPHFRSGN